MRRDSFEAGDILAFRGKYSQPGWAGLEQRRWEWMVQGRIEAEVSTPSETIREVNRKQNLISHVNEFGPYCKNQHGVLRRRVTPMIRIAF